MARINMDAYEEALKNDLVSYLKNGKGFVNGTQFIVECIEDYPQTSYLLYIRKNGTTKLMNKVTYEGCGHYSKDKWNIDQLYDNVNMLIDMANLM